MTMRCRPSRATSPRDYTPGAALRRRLHAARPDAGRQLRGVRRRDPRRRLQHAAADPAARARRSSTTAPVESNDSAADVANRLHAGRRARRASPISDINIIFNRLPPGPIPARRRHELRSSSRTSRSSSAGRRYESVFVNSNGNLTFGAGEQRRSPRVRPRC